MITNKQLFYLLAIPLVSFFPYDVPLWTMVVIGLAAAFAFWLVQWPGQDVKVNPVRASRFSPKLIPNKLDAIVIGSGSGGCACANLLAQAGKRVLLLEQHEERTGGCTHSFRQEGCEWDTGLHYTSIGMSKTTQRPGALLNFMTKGKQKFTRLEDPYDQVYFPPDSNVKPGCPNHQLYSFVTGGENTIDSILHNIDPNNEELKKKCMIWMELCRFINDGFTALGISRVLPSFLHFLLKKRIDNLMKLASYCVWDVQYAVFNLGYNIEDLLRDCPKAPSPTDPDPVLRRVKAVLTHPIGDYAVQPRDATFAAHGITMAHYEMGAAYTVGATQNISIRSSSLVRAMGGEVLIDATVNEIIMENGRAVGVRVTNTSDANNKGDPTEIRAPNIICATSVYNLYNKLLPQDHPIVRDFQDPTKRSIRQSNGHVFLFCKMKGDPTDLELPTHNLWYFNGYDLDLAFDKYFANPEGERPPTVYIGFPCTKDPTWKKRLPGISNCILISDGLWEWFEKWEGTTVHNRGPEYEVFKSKLTKHLLDILYETVPQLRGKVEYFTLGTPLTEVTYLSSWHAGSYGTKCLPSMFAKMNRKWTTTPHTQIPGLYMAGSDAFLPAVCGAMYGGCFGAAAVLGHVHTMRMTWAFLRHFASTLREENPKMSWLESYTTAIQKLATDK
eukprot:scaffold36077_cov51-Attheya_sp.AAC.1